VRPLCRVLGREAALAARLWREGSREDGSQARTTDGRRERAEPADAGRLRAVGGGERSGGPRGQGGEDGVYRESGGAPGVADDEAALFALWAQLGIDAEDAEAGGGTRFLLGRVRGLGAEEVAALLEQAVGRGC
jgi:hypothetical protein